MSAIEELAERLSKLRTFGVRPGLASTLKVMAALESKYPDDFRPRYLHIAGTNGKGSTSAFLQSIMLEAGIRTGLFTSPHLVRINERIRIGKQEIGDDRFLKLAKKVEEAAGETGTSITFFEYLTLVAWEYFREEHVPYVVWETGLGGRFDCTSAQEPYVTLITNIGLEHTEYLGHTLEAIAWEKAGIIRPNVPNFTTALEPAATVIANRAAQLKAPNTQVEYVWGSIDSKKHFVSLPKIDIYNAEPGLIGQYQCANAALAISAADYCLKSEQLFDTDRLTAILAGVKKTVWPGRLQILNKEPLVILDCAHNPHCWEALSATLTELAPKGSWNLYFGMLAEKQPKEALRYLEPLAKEFHFVQVQNPRKLTLEDWGKCCPQGDPKFAKNFLSSNEAWTHLWNKVNEARESNSQEHFLLCGSCYLAGEFLALQSGTDRQNQDDPVGIKKG